MGCLSLRSQILPMAKSSTLEMFRKVGIAEGISFLLLLGIAMPMKYMMGLPKAVTYTGWIHGVLFVWYCYLAFMAGQENKWSFKISFLSFLAALLPFGPFVFDKVFLRKTKSGDIKTEDGIRMTED